MSVLLSSGFQAAVTTRVRSPLANPSILNIRFGNSTELVLKVTPIAHAKCYEVRAAAVGAENMPGPWQTVGLFTDSRSMTIDGLVPGTTYMFRVRAIGGSNGYSDWSNTVSRMCAWNNGNCPHYLFGAGQRNSGCLRYASVEPDRDRD
jgi:hypothetical protein